jgi:hypothetical protein
VKKNKKMLKPLISFDWAVKRLLRNKANFGILEGFLSELLLQDIKIERILESESNQEHEADKFNRVDILAEDANKQLIIIELQNTREYDYFQRMLFGASKAVIEYINMGEEYLNVRKVYSVNIVYFDLGQGSDYLYHGKTHFTGVHTCEKLMLSARQRDLFMKNTPGELFPEYYVVNVNQFDDIARDTLDEWIFYLKNGEIKEGSRAKGLAEVQEKLNTERMDKTEKAIYLRHLNNLSHEKSMLFSARYDGKADGISIVARRMKKSGEPVEKIMAFTGLSLVQIEGL